MKGPIVIAVVLAAAGTASAYPQFQLSKDQTCTDCHISPAGGSLLNENGQTVAETVSQWGTDPAFANGLVKLPDWVAISGDFRGASGYLQTPQKYLATFPMQADVYASAAYEGFRLYLEGGFRPSIYINATTVQPQPPWSREHYLMWQQNPESTEGLYVRVGRFMPVFGLRFAEHTDYNRRFGGTQLYAETYGAAVEYVTNQFEAHVTGFLRDPFIDTVEHDNGAAAYGEYRIDSATSVGAEGMFTVSPDDHKIRAGATAKRYFADPQLLVQGELQFVNQQLKVGAGAPNSIVAYALGSLFPHDAIMVDLGLGYYNENIRIKELDRECVDLNVHWFVTSHVEGILLTRGEFFDFGKGGPTGAYVLGMLHYRL